MVWLWLEIMVPGDISWVFEKNLNGAFSSIISATKQTELGLGWQWSLVGLQTTRPFNLGVEHMTWWWWWVWVTEHDDDNHVEDEDEVEVEDERWEREEERERERENKPERSEKKEIMGVGGGMGMIGGGKGYDWPHEGNVYAKPSIGQHSSSLPFSLFFFFSFLTFLSLFPKSHLPASSEKKSFVNGSFFSF